MSESVHVRMLQTVYQRLTGAHVDCPQYGSHWEHIGFQVHASANTHIHIKRFHMLLCRF